MRTQYLVVDRTKPCAPAGEASLPRFRQAQTQRVSHAFMRHRGAAQRMQAAERRRLPHVHRGAQPRWRARHTQQAREHAWRACPPSAPHLCGLVGLPSRCIPSQVRVDSGEGHKEVGVVALQASSGREEWGWGWGCGAGFRVAAQQPADARRSVGKQRCQIQAAKPRVLHRPAQHPTLLVVVESSNERMKGSVIQRAQARTCTHGWLCTPNNPGGQRGGAAPTCTHGWLCRWEM